jgi:hypothetical protein
MLLRHLTHAALDNSFSDNSVDFTLLLLQQHLLVLHGSRVLPQSQRSVVWAAFQ